MNTFVILPDQLFNDISVLEFLKDFDKIIIAEEPAYFRACSEGKIALVRAAMKSYFGHLEEQLAILNKKENNATRGNLTTKKIISESKACKRGLPLAEVHSIPKLLYIDVAKILPRGDIFEYLTGSRTQIHMFRIAACYTWGSKPWSSTYYGLPIKFHESPGFLVPYCEIKYGDIFISGSTRINKMGSMEASGVTFGEFVHRFFKIAIDNDDTSDSTRYNPEMTKIVTALPQSFSANSTIAGFKKSHNAINVEEFSYEPSYSQPVKLSKTANQRAAAKKYAKDVFVMLNKTPHAGISPPCVEKSHVGKTPRKTGSNPEIITRVNSDDLSEFLQKKSETCPDVRVKMLPRATSVMGGINAMAKASLANATPQSTITKTTTIKNATMKRSTINSSIEKPIAIKEINYKNYPISQLDANKLSIDFLNKFVRDYATYPTGAILELMFPLNMGLITPQMLLTHVLSVFGPQCKQNILLFLRDLLYREYLRCVYMTDSQFSDEKYCEIGSQSVAAAQRLLGSGDNLEKMSILELTKLKKNIPIQKFMGFAAAKLPWYFYWCGFLQI